MHSMAHMIWSLRLISDIRVVISGKRFSDIIPGFVLVTSSQMGGRVTNNAPDNEESVWHLVFGSPVR